jgi:shikimate kinase
MATGGGAPCFYNGIEVINNSGVSIFLDVAVDKLARRVEENSNRPLLQAEDHEVLKSKLEKIRESRITVYNQATITLQKATVNKLLDRLQLKR